MVRMKLLCYVMWNFLRFLPRRILGCGKIKVSNILFLHPSSEVKCDFGAELKIEKKVCMEKNSVVSVRKDACIQLQEHVYINRNCCIGARKGIVIAKNVSIGPNVCIYDHDHKYNENGVCSGYSCDDIVIGENCWIGAGAIILKGTHIGKNSIVAAGTVVKGNFEDGILICNEKSLKTKKL